VFRWFYSDPGQNAIRARHTCASCDPGPHWQDPLASGTGKTHPELNGHVRARCIFSHILIGVLPQTKAGTKSWAVECALGESHRPKIAVESNSDFRAASQLAFSNSRPLQMEKRVASSFLFQIREEFWGFWFEPSPAFLLRYPKAKCGKR
jgi:hypothetical protein